MKNLRFFLILFIINWGVYPKNNLHSKKVSDSLIEKIQKKDVVVNQLSNKKKYKEREAFLGSYIKWLYKIKQYDKGIELLDTIKNPMVIDTLNFKKQYYYFALCNYKQKNYINAIKIFKQLVVLKQNSIHKLDGRIYSQLGRCYNKKRDYYNAIANYKTANPLLKQNKDLKYLLANYINLSQTYINLENKESYQYALNYLLKADSLAIETNASFQKKYSIKKSIGNVYNQRENLNINKATQFYNEALKLSEKYNDAEKIAESYANLGNLYNTIDPAKSLVLQNKSLGYLTSKDSLRQFITRSNIGYANTALENFVEAEKNYIKSLEFFTGENLTITEDLFTLNIKNHFNLKYLLNTYKEVATLYFKMYSKKKDLIHLQINIQLYEFIDRLLDKILLNSEETQSKFFWRKQSAEVYGKAIKSCFLAKDYNKAYYFIEKSKAVLLSQQIKEQKLKQFAITSESINSVENNLTENVFNKSIKIVALKKLQKSLQPDEVIIEYNISDYEDYSKITANNGYEPIIEGKNYGKKTIHNSFALIITHKNVELFKLKNSALLEQKVQKLIKFLSKPFYDNIQFKEYKKEAFELYVNLFPTKKLRATLINKKTIIIPDAYLNFLSFEALVTSKKSSTYFLSTNEISYTYSNTFSKQLKNTKSQSENSLLAFAPVKFNELQLPELKNTETEIHNLTSHFSGISYTLQKATKEKFISELPNYTIIHLATHANAQDSIEPWIAFNNKKLRLKELYTYDNKAKMVVLSGCRTSLGKEAKGEGVMSLARGFFYSGAQSVVSSLWNVDDRSTAQIMDSFYKNLKNGTSKTTALRNAKLEYIKNHSLSETSPYYWASFILLGNTDPITNSLNISLWILISLAIIVLFFMGKRLSDRM